MTDGFRRVLVTGGAGFIGHHLVRSFRKARSEVVVIDDLSTGSAAHFTPDEDIRMIVSDVRDPQALAEAGPVDLIVHAAGIVGMRLANDKKREAYELSVESTEILLAKSQAPIVLISSSAIYGHNAGECHEQDVDEAGVLAYDGGEQGYALGKWHMEGLGRRAKAAGRSVVIVRPFNVVGEGQSGAYGMVLPSFVRRALNHEPLVVYDRGEQRRSFSHVRTFSTALVRLASTDAAWRSRVPAFNLGGVAETRILDLATKVIEKCESRGGICFEDYDAIFPGRRDVQARRPDISALTEIIGPIAWPSIDEIIDDVISSELGPVTAKGARP